MASLRSAPRNSHRLIETLFIFSNVCAAQCRTHVNNRHVMPPIGI
ncbi:hypothetical protein BSIN_0081 [Burkholderia singularis]|uniref:Uncharacterized protein n=1 Tax=Burkholderia singularis TaxID=1503053 RepID=A0A238H229_9BURK|nr:hypothetical protein BSIN_0081 [Burkholderia singularis]